MERPGLSKVGLNQFVLVLVIVIGCFRFTVSMPQD